MPVPTVFLSAATIDMKEWRDALHGAFSRAGFRVLTQDQSLRAAPGDVKRLLTETIDESDCIIHLAGDGYGSHATDPFPDAPTFRCSWTQFEYYLAHRKKKDVIAFVCAPSLSRVDFTEEGDAVEKAEKHLLQQTHRDRVASGEFTGTPLEGQARTLNEKVYSFPDLLKAVSAAVGTLYRLDQKARDKAREHLEVQTADIATLIRESEQRLLAALKPASGAAAPTSALPWRLQLDRYALFAIRNFGRVELLQALARSDEDSQVTLGQVFVEPELATLREPRSKDLENTQEGWQETHKSPAAAEAARLEMLGKEAAVGIGTVVSRQPAFEVLCGDQPALHVILGDPGAGKSTLLRLIVLQWAEDHLRRGCDREGATAPAPVPLLTEVRAWLAAREAQPTLTLLEYHCREELSEYHFHPADLEAAVTEGRASLLVDGLDEAFVRQTRDLLRTQIRTLAADWPALRVLVTSRGFNFEAAPWRDSVLPPHTREWTFHTVEPFDDDRIALFLDRWRHDHDPALNEKRRAALTEAINNNPHVRRLALNPMLLTLVCLVVRGGRAEGGSGPRDISRRNLYDEAERHLLHRWDNDRGLPAAEGAAAALLPRLSFEEKRSFFLQVAATMTDNAEAARQQVGAKAAPKDLPDSNQIREPSLKEILARVAPNDDPAEVLRILRERNYLLCYRGDATYSFIHRSFLEYFTALNWAVAYENGDYDGPNDLFNTVILPYWQDETWHETLRFLIALLKNPVAVQCLDLLAKVPPLEIEGDMAQKKGDPVQREQPALVLAAELSCEVSPLVHTGGPRPGKTPLRLTLDDLKAAWKGPLLRLAGSTWDAEKTSGEEDAHRYALRRRAILALAALWPGDASVRDSLLRMVCLSTLYAVSGEALGEALRSGWPDDPLPKIVLIGALIGSGNSASGPDEDWEVRSRAASALGSGWAEDDEVKDALLQVLVGFKISPIGRDPDQEVRRTAADALRSGWAGDAEMVAAFRQAGEEY